jgi:hypothetical protein
MAATEFTALTAQQIASRFRDLSYAFHQANRNQGNRPCESHRFEDCPAEVCRNNRTFADAINIGWQPIASAPKDGREILLTDGTYKRTGYWARRIGVWSVDTVVSLNMPTHWMALPTFPPREEGGVSNV